MANWTRRDVWAYLKQYDLPRNPLYNLGYASIGCAPAEPGAPTWVDDVAPILASNCIRCHGSPPLGAPAAVLGAANFGTITTAGDPRVAQMAVKMVF